MAKVTVEDIILSNDRRGISILKPYLPSGYCKDAALSVLNSSGTAFIVTGFFIVNANSPETDGPPGAVAIARALKYLGYKVYFITDQYSFALMQILSGNNNAVINFPISDDTESRKCALALIADYNPSLIISIERCGRTAEGTYLDMSGIDISEHNAKIDYLFYSHPKTIGIGDGGNEIGMGNYADVISKTEGLPKKPSVTKTAHTIISSVSNWGGYGLVAELSISKPVKHNLLFSLNEENELIKQAIKYGAVDGITKRHEPKVDGFSLDENGKALRTLHRFVNEYLLNMSNLEKK